MRRPVLAGLVVLAALSAPAPATAERGLLYVEVPGFWQRDSVDAETTREICDALGYPEESNSGDWHAIWAGALAYYDLKPGSHEGAMAGGQIGITSVQAAKLRVCRDKGMHP